MIGCTNGNNSSSATSSDQYPLALGIGMRSSRDLKAKPKQKGVQISHPTKGLPPLRRHSDNNDLLKRKEKVKKQLNEHKEREKKRRCSTYEKAMMYHNIHNVAKNYFNNIDNQANEYSKLKGIDYPRRRLSDNSSKVPIYLPATTRYLDVRSASPKKDLKKKTKSNMKSINSVNLAVNLTKIG